MKICPLFVAGIVSVLLGSARAQFPLVLDTEQDPYEQVQEQYLRERLMQEIQFQERLMEFTFPYSEIPREAPLPFHLTYGPGLQQMFPYYQGVPTGGAGDVAGFGGYPGALSEEPPLAQLPRLERPPLAGDRWPSWIEGGVGTDVRATAERAVLVRVSDRVWFLDAEETAFIPLAFYDRFRFLRTGSRIEVRGRGEYQAVMYDGSSVRSNGPSSITVVHMGEQEVVLQIDNLEQMWVTAALRPTRVRLPDGTELVFVDGQIRLENLGDRFRVSNEGSSVVTYSGSAGQGELDGPQFISVWKAPPDSDALAQQLQLSGDVAMVQGVEGTEVRGGRGGAVVVTGARFAVEQGSSLVIKPLGPPGIRE